MMKVAFQISEEENGFINELYYYTTFSCKNSRDKASFSSYQDA